MKESGFGFCTSSIQIIQARARIFANDITLSFFSRERSQIQKYLFILKVNFSFDIEII